MVVLYSLISISIDSLHASTCTYLLTFFSRINTVITYLFFLVEYCINVYLMCSLSAFHTKHAIMLNLFCYQGQVWGCTCAFHTSPCILNFFFLCQGKNTSSGCTFNKLATMLVYVIFFQCFNTTKSHLWLIDNWLLSKGCGEGFVL